MRGRMNTIAVVSARPEDGYPASVGGRPSYEAAKTIAALHDRDREAQDARLLRDVAALHPCSYCGDPSEPGLRICTGCSREEALD